MPIYANEGNPFVAGLVPRDARRLLDIGCGCGDTGALLKHSRAGLWIEGITFNPLEADKAAAVLDRVHMLDIERDLPSDLGAFDCLIFSHVLEHVRHPAEVLERFLPHLAADGTLVIAVPNIVEWRTRLRLLRGDFAYAEDGILDRTHLRFFTFDTLERELLTPEVRARLRNVTKIGQGSVPLGPLRRLPFMRDIARAADSFGAVTFPNLFAQQIAIVARKSANA